MEPIIKSLLDIDFYKFTMGQLIFLKYRNVQVKFAFKNRTLSIRLADVIDEQELRNQLDHLKTLKLAKEEYEFMKRQKVGKKRMFCKRYLRFLLKFRPCDYRLEKQDGQYILEFFGPWSRATYSEIYALSIISQLNTYQALKKQGRSMEDMWKYGQEKLEEKIRILEKRPSATFADFGTRRRATYDWHEHVIVFMKQRLPKQFIGTSNTYFAMKYDLNPIGTSAHELPMVYAAISKTNKRIFNAPYRVVRDLWNLYGYPLSISLPDTFGTKSFLSGLSPKWGRKLKGFRQDSGNCFEIGESYIRYYRENNIDPKTKLALFSDGLEAENIVELDEYFASSIKHSAGWGTGLTNDVGIKTVSIVIKVIEANGRPAVKLSDNIEKAIGDPKEIEKYKLIFGYSEDYRQECKY